MGPSQQLQALLSLVGEDELMNCLINKEVTDKVSVAALLSKTSDGKLTTKDTDTINSL
jgi:hypothetical protein